MTETNKLIKEWNKCKLSSYYFATTYCKVIDKEGNEHSYSTILSEEEFNNYVWNYTSNTKMN